MEDREDDADWNQRQDAAGHEWREIQCHYRVKEGPNNRKDHGNHDDVEYIDGKESGSTSALPCHGS